MDDQALETSQEGAGGEFRAGTDSAEKVAELRMLVKERLMCEPEARYYCDDAALRRVLRARDGRVKKAHTYLTEVLVKHPESAVHISTFSLSRSSRTHCHEHPLPGQGAPSLSSAISLPTFIMAHVLGNRVLPVC